MQALLPPAGRGKAQAATGARMKRLILWMERAGALFLFVIMVVIATTTVTRYLFNWPIPDGDSLARMLLAVVVFWGFAAACLHGEHIQLDLFTERLPPRPRALVYRLTAALMFGAVATATWAAWHRIGDLRASGEITYDLGLPLWPFYALAFLGLVAASLVLLVVLLGLVRIPERDKGPGQ